MKFITDCLSWSVPNELYYRLFDMERTCLTWSVPNEVYYRLFELERT